jgi:hypothetical protein
MRYYGVNLVRIPYAAVIPAMQLMLTNAGTDLLCQAHWLRPDVVCQHRCSETVPNGPYSIREQPMSNRGVRHLLGAVALAALVAACGAAPYTYVKNSGDHTYFKVPRGWSQIDRDSLDQLLRPSNPDSATAALQRRLTWSVGFDASIAPAAEHLLEVKDDQPFVYVSVTHLTSTQRDAVSLNVLRDFVLPVSADARQAAATNLFPLQGFELLYDKVLNSTKGVHGVHTVYSYLFPDQQLQTFDQTTYVSNDEGTVYLMLITCSARCHRDRASELNRVVDSFTVRSQ